MRVFGAIVVGARLPWGKRKSGSCGGAAGATLAWRSPNARLSNRKKWITLMRTSQTVMRIKAKCESSILKSS